MDNKYKVFQKGFHKVLDLVETADENAIKYYENLVGNLPVEVLLKMLECEDFNITNDNYIAEAVRLVNEINFEFVRNKKFAQIEMNVHRIFEEDLYKDEVRIRLFSFYARNVKNRPKALQVFLQENNGKYKLEKLENDDKNLIDINCEVFLERIDDDFYLRTRKTIRGWEVCDKIVPVSFDEIIQCVEIEDEYEEDIEMELDFDV